MHTRCVWFQCAAHGHQGPHPPAQHCEGQHQGGPLAASVTPIITLSLYSQRSHFCAPPHIPLSRTKEIQVLGIPVCSLYKSFRFGVFQLGIFCSFKRVPTCGGISPCRS